MFVACYLPKYKNEIPQIGKVVDISSTSPEAVDIEWLVGTFSSTWKILKQRQGGEYAPWRERIQRSDIILFPIQLTNGYRLQKKTVTELKTAYSLLL